MSYSPPATAQAPARPRSRARVSPRVRARRRRLLLLAAVSTSILAGVFTALDHGPEVARWAEEVSWSFSPAAPVVRLAAAPSTDRLDLSWGANESAASYSVVVARDAALTDPVARMTTLSPTATVTGLEQGTTYYYRVSWTSELGNAGVASAVEPVTTSFHAVAAPTDVAVTASASDYTLSWAPVEWATEYVVRMSVSDDPAAFGASPADVEFPATTATTFTTPAISKATAGERYYFTVRAANRDLSTAVSGVVGGRLLIDAPATASVVGASTTGVTVSWAPVPGARTYVIERSSTADFAVVDGSDAVPRAYAQMSVNGLAPGTEYFFRVHAENGAHLGQNSTVVSAATTTAGAVDVRVATYNVLDPKLGKKLGPWSERRKNLARTIDASGAGIVALQEAGWSKVKHGLTPAQDLAKLTSIGLKRSKAGYKGDQLLYSAKKYEALTHGSFRLPRIAGDGVRSAIWQKFRDRATGARFVVVSTHLTNGIENNAGRVKQADRIIAKLHDVNPSGLPVVLMGDLNSYDARASITPMSMFADAGYLDAELSTPETATPTLNTWVKATSATGSIRFDHIAVSTSVAVTRTAIEDPDLTGPASDHRLLWADLAISTS